MAYNFPAEVPINSSFKYQYEASLVKIGYSLNKINEWDEKAVVHILSRTLFGYTQQDIDFALSLTLDEFVDNHLLAEKPEPTP
ncbi:MAG: hypothetical protein EHM47_06645, partial [Ignavibacteriales bacterium]